MINDQVLLFSSIIVTLFCGVVGMIGLVSVYAIFPIIIYPEPTCVCDWLQKEYESLRQLTSILGWFFSFIPFIIWKIWVNTELNKEIKN